MANIDVGIVRWDGWPGAPGFSVFYATPGGSFMAQLRTFFDAIKANIAPSLTLSFPSSGDTIDDATGHLVGSWSGATLANVVTPASGAYSGPSGAVINWMTNTIVPVGSSSKTSHRMRGRTFIVPVQPALYTNNGDLQASSVLGIKTAADALISGGAGHMVLWHRPATGASDGVSGPVISSSVHTRIAVLRSRRD